MRTLETALTTITCTHRPWAWICACFIAGIIINEYLNVSFAGLVFLTAFLMLVSLLVRRPGPAAVFLLLTVVSLGSVYAKSYQTVSSHHIDKLSYGYRKDPVLVEGTVVSDVEPRPFFKGKKTVFALEVGRIKTKWGWRRKSGMILVNLFRQEDIRYGDYLILEGKLHRPFNFAGDSNFSYREYLRRKGITFILSVKKAGRAEVLEHRRGHFLKDLSLRFKHRLGGILKENLPREEAGLMQAFLLGDRYDIPKDVYDLFKVSGVAHIIAISGFNIGIVAYVLFLILKMFPIPRRAQYILTMVLLVFYAFLTGGQPPVVRATIMAVVFLTSFVIEREQESLNTLFLAAWIILLRNPLNLFDVGFQLSFISVLSIILFSPGFREILCRLFPAGKTVPGEDKESARPGGISVMRRGVIQYLLHSTALSLSAYLGVAALIAYYFHLITPVVIIANLVIVPLASLIIFLGMGLLAAGLIFPFAAFAFANCLSVLLNLMVVSVFFFVQVPGAYFPLDSVSLGTVLLCYGLIVLGFCAAPFMEGMFKRRSPTIDGGIIDKEAGVC